MQENTNIAGHTTGVYLFLRLPLIWSHGRLRGGLTRCKQLLSSGAFWGSGTTGGFGLNLEVSVGMMPGFGDRRGFLLRSWWNNNNACLARLKFAHENPLPSRSLRLMCRRWQSLPLTVYMQMSSLGSLLLREPPSSARESQIDTEISSERDRVGLFCLCLSCLFLKGFLKDDNIF